VAKSFLSFVCVGRICMRFRFVSQGQCRSLVLSSSETGSDFRSWGQEGGSLATVCADPSVDVVALAFLTDFFGTGGLPVINFAGSCSGPTFPGTNLLECSQIG